MLSTGNGLPGSGLTARPYRHSRVSGNPERYSQRPGYRRPPYRHSRVSGNPGRYRQRPAYRRPPLPSFPRKRESRTVLPKTRILPAGFSGFPLTRE